MNQSTFRVTGTQRVSIEITRAELADALSVEIRRKLGDVAAGAVRDLVTTPDGQQVIHRPSNARWTNPRAAALVNAMHILLTDELQHVAVETQDALSVPAPDAPAEATQPALTGGKGD